MLLSTRKTVGAARPTRRVSAAARTDSAYGPTVIEQPVRTILDWTPEQVASAILQADSGNLTKAADLCERLMCDARIRGILATRTYGMFGLPVEFHGPENQVEALKGTEDDPGQWWTLHPESELARFTGWGIMLGVALAQRVPQKERAVGAPDVPTIRVWHPRWLRFQFGTGEGFPDKWFLMTAQGEIEIHPGDGQWILYCPYGESRPWAEGAWRALAEAWILKQYAKHDRARFTEVAGSPVRVGTAPQGASEKTRKGWQRQLRSMGRDTSMVLPAGYDFKAVSINGTGNAEIFDSSIHLSNEDIAITLTGQLVTTEGTAGFSSGDIHERIAHELTKSTAESLATTLHNQSLKPWAGSNYGTTEQVAYGTWDIDKPEDKKAKAETIGAFADAVSKANGVLASAGKRVNVIEMGEDYGLELEDLPTTKETAPNIPLAPTDVAKVVRVDEARAGAGLEPWGGDDGQLTVTQFDAKNAPPAPSPFGGGGGAPPFGKADGAPAKDDGTPEGEPPPPLPKPKGPKFLQDTEAP